MDLIERAAQEFAKKNAKGKKKAKAATGAAKKPFKAIGGKKTQPTDQMTKTVKKIAKSPTPDPTAMGGFGLDNKSKRPHNYLSDALESAVEANKLKKVTAKKVEGIKTGTSGSKLFGSKAEGQEGVDIVEVKKPTSKANTNIKGNDTESPHSASIVELDFAMLREGGYIMPDMPPNMMAEEFRIIKRSILLNAFSGGNNDVKHSNVVMVTSSNPNEGKTYCAINLALSIATEQDTTVLLIDSDFSKPEILNRIGARGGKGVMDILADPEIDVRDCLLKTNIPNLVVLPAGRQSNRSTELIASDRMSAIVHELSTRYPDRLVIFDAPPVLASSIPSVLSLNVGQTVFVIEAENTTESMIKESLTMIKACPNIGLLLNKTRAGSSNKKFATYYGYGGS